MKDYQYDIYALIGNPVGHSMSPVMHNYAYRTMGVKACYVSFNVDDLQNALRGIRALGIRGVSVTIPHKVEVMKYLDEVDEDALRIGAVNTIVNEKGKLKGINTDWQGIVKTLKETMEIKNKKFAILGAGGTALAALFGIFREGGMPIIINRTEEKGRRLANEWNCPFFKLTEIADVKADCLINTTPVGMQPQVDRSPVPHGVLKNFNFVMDVIYNPLQTSLMRDAHHRGLKAISGLGMFIHQGAEQIRIWTGQEPPMDLMREIVLKSLLEQE